MMNHYLDYIYEQDFDREMEIEWLANVLYGLSGREIDILQMRYGLQGRKAMSLNEIGQQLGVTAERVRQLEGRALKKLRVWAGME